MEAFKSEKHNAEASLETLVQAFDEILSQDSIPAQALKAACNAQGIPHESIGVFLEDATTTQRAQLSELLEKLVRHFDADDLRAYETLKPIAKDIVDIIKTL